MKKEINAILFNVDPMNTCCKENDCFDEYIAEAALIANLIHDEQMKFQKVSAISISEIVSMTFEYMFFEQCLSQETIEKIAKQIDFAVNSEVK